MRKYKIIVVLSFLSFSILSTAQLFVRPGSPTDPSYVFVNNTLLYVDQDVELEINPNPLEESSIILRRGAQMIQGNGADQDNKGTGDISVYQEGTVNQFDYNYWGSPVGLSFNGTGGGAPNGNSNFSMRPVNAGFADTNQILFYPTSLTNSNPALLAGGFDSSVVTGGPLNLATYWLWSFQSGADYANWTHIDDTGTLPAGFGFTMKGVGGTDTTDAEGNGVANNPGGQQRYDFRGRPNNGTISVPVGAGRLSLLGNPYPSAINLNYFLLENSGTGNFNAPDLNDSTKNLVVSRSELTTGIAYFWDSNPNVMSHFLVDYQGGYGTYSPMQSVFSAGVYVNATFYMYDETGAQIPGSDIPNAGGVFERWYAPIGQGFMVEGDAGGMVQFKNNHREFRQEGNNSDFKNAEHTLKSKKNKVDNRIAEVTTTSTGRLTAIKIGIGINDTYSRELGIGLSDLATKGYDVAGDAKVGLLPTDASFVIEEKKGYVINAAPQDKYQSLPITLDAEIPSEYRFLAHYTKNFNYEGVYLYDRITKAHYDILNESVLIQLDAGEHKGRFFIRFTESTNESTENEETASEETETTNENENQENDTVLSLDEAVLENGVLESFSIFQNNSSKQLDIHNPTSSSIERMSLYDVTGKLVLSENDLEQQSIYSFPTGNLSSGIYIVKFSTSEGFTKAQKIRIAN